MDPASLLASFLLVTLAELGDKTQLALISLASCSSEFVVFTGAMMAFILVPAIGVAVGDIISMLVPPQAISFMSAILFLAFGMYMILTRNRKECFGEADSKYALLSAFSMITLMELGDKTQMTVIALAAKYDAPVTVYTGVIMAFTLLTILGVFLGRMFSKRIPLKYIKLGSGAIFLVFGIFSLIEYWNISGLGI